MISEIDNSAISAVQTPAGKKVPLHGHIRSFALRQGRLTEAQRNALASLWPVYGLEPNRKFDAYAIFNRAAPVVVEIGFGNGDTLAHMAGVQPETDFLGIEVHRPGLGHLLLQLREHQLTNVRVYCADAVEVLEHNISDNSLDGVNLFFPDPWPKKRHHKRRLVHPDFMRLVVRKLKCGGFFHAATDWKDYAQHMLSVLEGFCELENVAGRDRYSIRPAYRPLTKFESRAQRLGHGVWDLIFRRN